MAYSEALTEAWEYHRRWSLVAARAQGRIDRRLYAVIVLLVSGALAGAVAAQPGWSDLVTGVAAGVASGPLALAAFVQQRWLTADEIGRWPAARAASETLKAEVARFLVVVAPYDGGDAEPEQLLRRQIDAVQERADGSPGRLTDFQEQRSDGRALPPIDGFDGYRDERALEQARWHRDRIGHHRGRASWIRRAEVAVSLVGVVLGAVAAGRGTTGLAGWIAVTATVAATLVAHRASTEHERIAASYAVTADLLDRLVRRLPASPDATQRGQFVTDVEARLAAQNQSWLELFPS